MAVVDPLPSELRVARHSEYRRRTNDLIWMTIILLVGFVLRLSYLGKPSLWLDEAITWQVVSAPFMEGLERVLSDLGMAPLYYLLLRPLAAVDQSEFTLRFLSVMLGLVSIALTYRLASAMAGSSGRERWTVLLAAGLLAVNPFHIWYAREARCFVLVFLLSVMILFSFHRVLRGQSGWIGFTIASSFAYLTHQLTMLLGLAQLVYFLLNFRQRHSLLRRWVGAQLLATLPLLFWILAVSLAGNFQAALGWIPQASPWAPLITLWNFALLYVDHNLWWGMAGLPLFAATLVLGIRARRDRSLLLLWLFVPCLTILLLSLGMGYGFYVDRYFITGLPAFVVLLARGVAQVRERQIRTALAVSLLLVSAAATLRIYSAPELAKQDWRQAVAIMADNWQSGDLKVVHTPTDATPLAYYYFRREGTRLAPPYPEGNFWQAALVRTGVAPWTYLVPRPEGDPWQAILDEYRPRRVWLVVANAHHSNHRGSSGPAYDVFQDGSPVVTNWLNMHQDQVLQQYILTGITVVLVDTALDSDITLADGGAVRVSPIGGHR